MCSACIDYHVDSFGMLLRTCLLYLLCIAFNRPVPVLESSSMKESIQDVFIVPILYCCVCGGLNCNFKPICFDSPSSLPDTAFGHFDCCLGFAIDACDPCRRPMGSF